MMTFTGNSNNKVNFTRSSFYADFFQTENPQCTESQRVWSKQVPIPEAQYHPVGQHLGGLWLQVPMYDRGQQNVPADISHPVNCYFRVVKTKKNKKTEIEVNPCTIRLTFMRTQGL